MYTLSCLKFYDGTAGLGAWGLGGRRKLKTKGEGPGRQIPRIDFCFFTTLLSFCSFAAGPPQRSESYDYRHFLTMTLLLSNYCRRLASYIERESVCVLCTYSRIIHTNISIHAYIHAYIHTDIQIYMCMYIRIHIHMVYYIQHPPPVVQISLIVKLNNP